MATLFILLQIMKRKVSSKERRACWERLCSLYTAQTSQPRGVSAQPPLCGQVHALWGGLAQEAGAILSLAFCHSSRGTMHASGGLSKYSLGDFPQTSWEAYEFGWGRKTHAGFPIGSQAGCPGVSQKSLFQSMSYFQG